MAVSLVLPCYNPPKDWEQNVCSSYRVFCGRTGEDAELVVVLDGAGSTVANEALTFLSQNISHLKVVQYEENRGKGYALRKGVEVVTGDIIIYTDVDFPYTMDSMCAIYDGLNNNEFDVGVGVKNDAYYAHVPYVRKVISRFLRLLIRVFLSMPVTDTQCGLKGFRSPVASLFLKTTIDRYLFDLEFIRNCFKAKEFRVQAVKVALNENVRFRRMDYRILLPEMINFIRLLFK